MLNRLIVFVMYLYKTITRKFKRNPRVDSKSMRIHTWYKKIDHGEDNKTQTCVVNWTLTKRSYLVYIEALRITRFGKGNNQTVISYFFESWYYLSPSSFFSFSFLFFFFLEWSEWFSCSFCASLIYLYLIVFPKFSMFFYIYIFNEVHITRT